LCLRPLTLADGPRLRDLVGDRRVAATTAQIPHPYPDGAAEAYIRTHEPAAAAGTAFTFGVTLTGTRTPGRENDPSETGYLVGAIVLRVTEDPDERRGELGYWVGVPYWNKGFATEAVRAVLDFGFSRRHLHRITAYHFCNNPASGRVLQKVGMTYEGTLRAHQFKWGEYLDVALYGLLDDEWERLRKPKKAAVALQPA
jgi:RimJ/RimL family protein N-acetyltransferase